MLIYLGEFDVNLSLIILAEPHLSDVGAVNHKRIIREKRLSTDDGEIRKQPTERVEMRSVVNHHVSDHFPQGEFKAVDLFRLIININAGAGEKKRKISQNLVGEELRDREGLSLPKKTKIKKTNQKIYHCALCQQFQLNVMVNAHALTGDFFIA